MDEETQRLAKESDFWDYLAKNVPGHYQWGQLIDLDTLLSHSINIDEPILLLPKSKKEQSLNAFKEILKFCGDIEADDAQKKEAIMRLYKISLKKSKRLKDEIILLIIKQIRKNTTPSSVVRAWTLLANLLSVVKPSKGFTLPLLNWLMKVIDHSPEKGYQDWAKYIVMRVYKMYKIKDERVF